MLSHPSPFERGCGHLPTIGSYASEPAPRLNERSTGGDPQSRRRRGQGSEEACPITASAGLRQPGLDHLLHHELVQVHAVPPRHANPA
jgi:hypothetical protein